MNEPGATEDSFAALPREKKLTRTRIDGLCLLFLGATVVFLLTGYLLKSTSSASSQDFKSDYFSSQCLIHNCDPYKEGDVLHLYLTQGGSSPSENELDRQVATRYVYPPTAFSLMLPFALLPWGSAHIVWMLTSAGCLLLASFLAWDLGADFAPVFCGGLIGFLLANSEVVVVLSNPSEIVVGLCVIAVWCLLRNRFVPLGIVCLAISLAVKPQVPGLIWCYLVLAGGLLRKRALQSLLALVMISLPAVLRVWHLSAHWLQELHFNLLAFSKPGGLNDPGPSSANAHDLIDLPVVLSYFRDDPRFYNPVSYLIILPFLIVWAAITLRTSYSQKSAFLALAAIVPLSMLPIHHHLYDTKLLLLTVPACAMLMAAGGVIGRLAFLVNSVVFVLTGDLSGALFSAIVNRLHPANRMLQALPVFSVPLALLLMGTFYLWIYARNARSATADHSIAPDHAQMAPAPPS